METEIPVPRSRGLVRGIAVKAGDAVAVGDTTDDSGVRMRSGNGKSERLIQGMGLMHLGAGQAVMLLVSLLLLWLAIAKKKFEPLLLLPIGFGGLLQYPGGRAGAHRPGRACWLTTTRRSWR